MKRHRANKKATATIALYKVEDPSRYGVAELAQDNQVIRFVEKPSREKAPSNLVNAGIYVLEPEIFDYIPSGKRVANPLPDSEGLAPPGAHHGDDTFLGSGEQKSLG